MRKQLFILVLFSFQQLFSQKKLEGILLDKATNSPIEFVNLSLKGNPSTGTVSNQDGRFQLLFEKTDDFDSLIISHINYLTRVLPLNDLVTQSQIRLFLSENIVELKEIRVGNSEDFDAFEEIISKTKKKLRFPSSSSVYYRELVKGNKSYTRYADAILAVGYEQTKDNNDIKIKVIQCRAIKLPKDDEDKFEMLSPVKMDLVLGQSFGNFLNRFKSNQKDYHFYFFKNSQKDENMLFIEPKKEVSRENDKILYKAIIKTDNNNIMKDVQIELDSTCHFEKSLLGLKYAVSNSRIILSFKTTNDFSYLSFARLNFVMKFSTKTFQQNEDFVSEFLIIETPISNASLDKKDLYRKSSLYKHGSKYDFEFWKGRNLPIFSVEEQKLLSDLEAKQKVN